jgi:hypothetical protein
MRQYIDIKMFLWYIDCMRRVHTPPFRAFIKGMYPETNTLPKQHTSPFRARLLIYGAIFMGIIYKTGSISQCVMCRLGFFTIFP